MKRLFIFLLWGVSACLSAAELSDHLVVSQAVVREVPPGARVTGAFMVLTNQSQQDEVIVSAASEVAEHVELHLSSMVDGAMKMEMVPSLLVPAGESLQLKPGSYHIMLIDLKKTLKLGDEVLITLTFSGGGQQTISAKVSRVKAM